MDNTFSNVGQIEFDDEYHLKKMAANANGMLYFFGGFKNNSLWSFDTSKGTYQLVTTKTPGPSGRFDHAMVAYDDGFFLQGGRNVNNTILTDLWQFTKSDWSPIPGVSIPAAGHSAVYSSTNNATIYFIGGYVDEITQAVIVSYDIGSKQKYTPSATSYPSPRSFASASIAGNRLFIYGGEYAKLINLNDAWQFVDERSCKSSANCESCVGLDGCAFCPGTPSYSCVAGNASLAYISSTCPMALNKMVELCPETFPSWAIALIVIGGVVLIGAIVFGIMKLRGKREGYAPV
jgi:hypothetical protein